MLGFSVYLSQPLDAQRQNYLQTMAQIGFQGVFTSLNLPEDDATVLAQRLGQLASWCQQNNLALTVDLSDFALKRLGWSLADPQSLRRLGLTGIRVDSGLSWQQVAQLSHYLTVAVNASTFNEADYQALRANNANLANIEAWHNYYPRPETGLDITWYQHQNQFLQNLGLKTMGFIAGDGSLRGPLYQHLPTLEAQREQLPLASFLQLRQLATDHVYISDNSLSTLSQAMFATYIKEQVIELYFADLPPVLQKTFWHNRPDFAQQVVRLQESRQRQLLNCAIQQVARRPLGTLTCDNERYQRYAGELQITKCDLPKNPAVNVVAHLIPAQLDLLPYIGANQKLQLLAATVN